MERIKELDRKYGLFRAAQFGIAGVIGFLALEGILVAGLYAIYGRVDVPSDFASSPTLVALDIFASVVGVVVGFFANERTTVRRAAGNQGKGWRSTIVRLGKFEGVYALGSGVTIGVQLVLLAAFGVSPAIGNIVGAVGAYPPSYLISMRFVWKT
jgi:putative flippase GtrA